MSNGPIRFKDINPVSTETCHLEVCAGDESIMTASGFVVEHRGVRHLVTNWHVLSNRERETRHYLKKDPRFPTSVRLTAATVDDLGNLAAESYEIEIARGFEEVLWRQHPENGWNFDVATLRLPAELAFRGRTLDINRSPIPQVPSIRFRARIANAVMVVGYPFGVAGGAPGVAVWKQGTIASEPSLPFGELPRILIDSQTRDGMSGSPVYLLPSGMSPSPDDEGFFFSIEPGTTQFLGIYSGRLEDDDLGFVWHPDVIETVLDRGVPGTPV